MASGIIGLNKERTIWFHFNKDIKISSIRVAPYIQNRIKSNEPHTLYYWERGWKEVETQQTISSFFTFQYVPDKRLYMLRNQQWAKNNPASSERIFLYKDGEVLWY